MSETASTSSRPTSPAPTVGAVPPIPPIPSHRAYRFQWDANRRSGPGSVISEAQTEGRDYFISSNPFYMQNVSSTNLGSAALPAEWSSSRHGFHAISTVLNNPHKKQAPPKAHSHLPTVPPADLPRVKRKDFEPYLRTVGPEWERFERSAQLGRSGSAILSDSQSSGSEPSPSTLFTPAPSSPITPRTPRIDHSQSLPPIDSVPSVFFQPKFDLGHPQTFALVTDSSNLSEDDDPIDLAHALPLLERLSHHADTVEQHLVREISARSSSFFAALTNLHDLRSESAQCLERVRSLRAELNSIGEQGARPGLEAVRKEVKLRNLGKLKEGVGVVKEVVDMTGVARGLVNASQWSEALGMVEQMEKMWENGVPSASNLTDAPGSTISLSSLKAFTELPSHLQALTTEIAMALSAELISTLQMDLCERGQAEAPLDLVILRDKLRPLLDGLIRTRSVMDTLTKWRESVMEEIRASVRRHLTALDPNPEDPEDPQVAGKLHEMSHPDFISVMETIYSGLLKSIEGLQTQNTTLAGFLASATHALDETELSSIQEELADILASAAELANASVAKVVGIRAEQHAALDLVSFVNVFDASWSFVIRCEVICRRMIVGLRGTIVSQAKSFLQTFHQARLSQAAKLVEDELWNPMDVPPDMQRVADMLVDCAMRDPPELSLKQTMTEVPSSQTNPTSIGSTPPAAASKHLKIEDRSYFIVGASLQTLVLLVDYVRLVLALETLTTDTMARCIEFLKAFNSRTCQVVLGAGAMRSAGLKNITAKHLALASQSLSIMITLIPYVREMFRRHLSAKQAVMLIEFDKLKRDYQEHQDEIHTKLIAIMGDRLSAHIRSLQAVNWEVPAKPGSGVNDYMELLVKETVTLHKVLSRYLALPVVEYVMSQVFASITHRLAEAYGAIDLQTIEAKNRLLVDARYLHEKLANLKGVRMPSNMLETVVSEKPIFLAPTSPLITPGSPGRQARSPTLPPPVSPPQPAPGTTANARIKGMFARATKLTTATAAFSDMKRAPSPTPTPIPSASEKALPLPSTNGDGLVHEADAQTSPLLPPKPQRTLSGFRQVEATDELGSENGQAEQ